MIRIIFSVLFITFSIQSFAQLTVEKIMRDPKWIGTSPSSPQWSVDGKTLYFNWNPEKAMADSLYYIQLNNREPKKATVAQKQNVVNAENITYNTSKSAYTFDKDGDIFYTDVKSGNTRRVTNTIDRESNPKFSFNQTKIVFTRSQNLFAWDMFTGETIQLTNIKTGKADDKKDKLTLQEEWLKNDQLKYFDILKFRKEKKEAGEAYKKNTEPKELRTIYTDDKRLQRLTISPDGRFVSFSLFKAATNAKATITPNYVTESGFTTDIPTRTKVGSPQGTTETFVFDRVRDSVFSVKPDSIPGIKDLPDYLADYPKQLEERKKKNADREASFSTATWSPNGTHLLFEIRSADNKDKWLMRWDTASHTLILIDRLRDNAWINYEGVFDASGWLDENTYWRLSEASGYSHLYTINVMTGEKKALTKGKYEVQQAKLSNDKKYFYLTTNEVHPGEKHFYKLTISTGLQEKITSLTGNNDVTISPDEKQFAILYSYTNKPTELFLLENKPGAKMAQVTDKAQSEEFKQYPWRDPEVITFTARDGATVYARLYKPTTPHANKPAVVFVHGAGYLQNAHKWWSTYFREYMFNNKLADDGYYVLDIDYRGSAGYGRDWRTGIYRHMGGKDLTDQEDGVKWLEKNYGINPKHVGMYGGSYGGFISLMAMFTKPGVFEAAACLRSVTDWANYNHGYTSNILNEPYTDSLAYRRSSPLYFAEGLKGHLLMLHGMLDVNVHFQDIVKLSQRLIELGKDNWELAVYPMEDHGFVEPSSWTDEYKRVYKLFEDVLKK